MPGTDVGMGLNSPAPLLSGLRSKVSLWLGPPSIHRRMQLLAFFPWAGAVAAVFASTFSHPDAEKVPPPAVANCMKDRRVCSCRREENIFGRLRFQAGGLGWECSSPPVATGGL